MSTYNVAVIQMKKHPRYSLSEPIYEEPLCNTYYYGETNHLNEYHGFGKLSTCDFTYIGEWKNNKRHGFGVESYKSGYYDIYACSWVNDTIYGIGEIRKKGKVYFGFFYQKPNDNKLYVLRRSRRIANYHPQNKGLVFKSKKRKNKKKTSNQVTCMYTNFICIYSIVFLILMLITHI